MVTNLVDENLNGNTTHVNTFWEFLLECGFDECGICELITSAKQHQIVTKYKKMLEDYVLTHDYSDGVEMLGVIEYVYHLISADINTYFTTKFGKLPSFHFDTHELLDQTHASELFALSSNQMHSMPNVEFGSKWIVGVIKELMEREI